MLKSIAVVAGSYLLSVVLVLATDPLLSRIFPGDFIKGRVPSDAALLASTALFVVVSMLCAWLCARLAPGRASRHVLWFFIVGEVMGVAAIIPKLDQRLASLVLVLLAAHLAGELLDRPATRQAPGRGCSLAITTSGGLSEGGGRIRRQAELWRGHLFPAPSCTAARRRSRTRRFFVRALAQLPSR